MDFSIFAERPDLFVQAFAVATLTQYFKHILQDTHQAHKPWAKLSKLLCPLILGLIWGLVDPAKVGSPLATRLEHGVLISGGVMLLFQLGKAARGAAKGDPS